LTSHFDVIVGGGSIAGLSFATEAASNGLSVLVLEEDGRVGEPEKCDGLVSQRALDRYIGPGPGCIQSRVRSGTVYSPSGRSASLDASRLDVIVIDRSAYEEQLAAAATANGSIVRTGVRVAGVSTENKGDVRVAVAASPSASLSDEYTCSYYVDATGPSGVMGRNRSGLIPAAKYEVEGDWFVDGEVEVHLDQKKYPGFFAWVIPRGDGVAKVGAAGMGINSFRTLDSFLEGRKFKIRSRVAAPIYVGGPMNDFTVGRIVYVGESAGQVKPTTAGGILGSVAGGLMAGRWMAESIRSRDPSLIANYQRDWEERFGKEFQLMKRLRQLYRHLSNDDLEKIVAALSSPSVSAKLSSTDFDFHASALLSALGSKLTLQLAGVLVSAEAKHALASLAQQQ
jgi:geranylgeranyl reductase family protein